MYKNSSCLFYWLYLIKNSHMYFVFQQAADAFKCYRVALFKVGANSVESLIWNIKHLEIWKTQLLSWKSSQAQYQTLVCTLPSSQVSKQRQRQKLQHILVFFLKSNHFSSSAEGILKTYRLLNLCEKILFFLFWPPRPRKMLAQQYEQAANASVWRADKV